MVILHSYGILVTYDEVLRFRVTVAKYFGERQYIAEPEIYLFRELRMNDAQVDSWINNYDLHTYTPNGKRETHAVAI